MTITAPVCFTENVITPELLEYIKARTAQGASKEQIATELSSHHWKQEDIDQAFQQLQNTTIQPTPTNPTTLSSNQSPRTHLNLLKSKYLNKTAIILLILIFLMIIGGGVYILSQSADFQIQRMFASLQNVTSVSYDGTTNLSLKLPNNAITSAFLSPKQSEMNTIPITITTYFQGLSDIHNPNNPSSDTTISLDASAAIIDLAAQVEARTINHQTYFKFLKLPDLGTSYLNSILNEWWTSGTSSSSITTANPLTRQDQKTILTMFQNHHVINLSKAQGHDSIRNSLTTKFDFTVSTDNLIAFLKDYQKIIAAKSNNTSNNGINEYMKDLHNLQPIHGSVWIGMWDGYLHRITFTIKSQPTAQYMQFTLDSDITLYNYNKPVSIIKPSSSKKLSDLQKQFDQEFQSSSPGVQNATSTQSAVLKSQLLFYPFMSVLKNLK